MGERTVPSHAGAAHGRALAYLDSPTLATWTGSSRARVALFRWYVRLFGYPELAAQRRFRPVQEMLGRCGGRVVLDLGAGNGLYSIADAIRRPGSLHFLADISARHMHRAEATGRALGLPVGAVVCSAEALPLRSASVDAVLLIEVLQFVDDDVRVVEEVGRVLRSGGLWLCEQECASDEPPVNAGGSRNRPEPRLTKRRKGHSVERLCRLASRAGLALQGSEVVSGRISRWWEGLEARILGRSRTLHLVLFPMGRALAWLSALSPLERTPGTVLYVFRKNVVAPDPVSGPRGSALDTVSTTG